MWELARLGAGSAVFPICCELTLAAAGVAEGGCSVAAKSRDTGSAPDLALAASGMAAADLTKKEGKKKKKKCLDELMC